MGGILKVNGVPILKEKKRLIGHEDVMEIFDQKLRFVYANHQTENTQEKMKRRSMGSLVYKSLKQSPKRQRSLNTPIRRSIKAIGRKRLSVGKPSPRLAYLASPK